MLTTPPAEGLHDPEVVPRKTAELLADLYARQGYLVIGSTSHRTIGEIIHATARVVTPYGIDVTGVPMIVVEVSGFDELYRQAQLLGSITETGAPGTARWPYYYRVEAAD